MADGHGVNRRDVMYNDFIIVGPDDDPAGIKGARDVIKALRKIVDSKAKFISRGDNSGLALVVEGDPKMFNPYGIIAVNPAKYKGIDYKGAMQLIDWITSAEGQKKIAEFSVDGQALFFPAASKAR